MNNKMKFSEFLETLTIEQAIEWNKTNEKTLYVDDDILSPAGFWMNDARQDAVETKFESLLAE